MAGREPPSSIQHDAARVESLSDLARLLRHLRRREARVRGGRELTYRQLAARTGWSVGIIGGYFTGTALPPTDRFDELVCLLGALPSEQGPLATARDRVDETRELREVAAAPSTTELPVPRGLPAARRGFVGRADELADLDAVRESFGDAANRTLPIAAITGMAGAGKTALAVHWAHRVADNFPDGQLFLDLRGYDFVDPIDPADALASLLHALGVSQAKLAIGLPERALQYRTLLADRRVLVILDNAADPEHARPLLPGSPSCMVVVTSRDSLAGLVATDGARRIPLEPLAPRDATTLLRRLVGARVDETPGAAQALVRHCGGLPLAICIAADVAVQRAGASLAELIVDLAREETRLDALDTGEARTAVRSVLSWSYRALSNDTRRLFRQLGVAPGPPMPVAAIAALAGTDVGRARRLLTDLTRAHMVTELPVGRYGFHDLLRAYAAERAADEDDECSRSVTVQRLLDYYLAAAMHADRMLDPYRPSIDARPPIAPVAFDCLRSDEDAYRWFDEERLNLLSAIHFAADSAYREHTWQLAWAIAGFLDRSGNWHDLARMSARVLEVADTTLAASYGHRGLALAASRLQLFHTALDHYRQVVTMLEELEDRPGLARILLNMCSLGAALPPATAAEYQRRALGLFQELGDVAGQTRALNNLAFCLMELEDYPAALVAAQDALALAEHVDDWEHTAGTLDTIADIQLRLGEPHEAIRSCEMALSLLQESGHRLMEAEILTHCGDAYAETGARRSAEGMWRRALAIYNEVNQPEADQIRSRLAGRRPVARH